MMPLGSPGDSLTHPESDMPDNEAAERLREWVEILPTGRVEFRQDVDAALAAERRATVERIQEAADAVETEHGYVDEWVEAEKWHAVQAILDEEAQGATEGKAAR